MILVCVKNCKACDDIAKKMPEMEKVILDADIRADNLLEIKLALYRLHHDGKFPCLLNDTLDSLICKKELLDNE